MPDAPFLINNPGEFPEYLNPGLLGRELVGSPLGAIDQLGLAARKLSPQASVGPNPLLDFPRL